MWVMLCTLASSIAAFAIPPAVGPTRGAVLQQKVPLGTVRTWIPPKGGRWSEEMRIVWTAPA